MPEVSGARLLSGPPAPQSGKRLLLISQHFPPGGGVGALRWQKFAGFAREFGWGLDVITNDPRAGGKRDDSRLAELPEGTRVFGVAPATLAIERIEQVARKARRRRRAISENGHPAATAAIADEPHLIPAGSVRWNLGHLRGWKRAYLAWRDVFQESAWSTPAGVVGRQLTRENGYQAVISSGPPHFAHVAAARVAASARIPLVLDLRDPWALRPALPIDVASPLWLLLSRRVERRVIRQASLIILNTELAEERMRAEYPAAGGRMLTVMNGLDDESLPPTSERNRFLVAYAGNIYIDRSPAILFRAAARLIRERAIRPEAFGLEFMGQSQPIAGQTVEQMAASLGLADYVRMHPPAPRAEALRFLAGASLLVSLPQRTPLSTPSKVFEYMMFEAWHLILARADTATAKVLRDTSMAVVDPEDEDAIWRVLADRFARFERGERPGRLPERHRFSRAHQADKLFRALAERIGTR
jgi:hypothetical protein